MGWMNLVSALAWPAVVLVMFMVLRRQIANLLPNLKHLKGPGGWEADFGRQASDVEKKAEALAPTRIESLTAGPAAPTWVSRAMALADVSPRAAVLESWITLEDQVRRIAEPYGRPRGVMNAVNTLTRGQVIPSEVTPLIRQLSDMRNQAAHLPDFEIPASAAVSFVEAVASIVNLLEGIDPTAPGVA